MRWMTNRFLRTCHATFLGFAKAQAHQSSSSQRLVRAIMAAMDVDHAEDLLQKISHGELIEKYTRLIP